MVPAQMRAGAGPVDVAIRDVSSRGMLVQSASPPPRGTYVEIIRPALQVTGRVVWSRGGRFGIQTRERISRSALLERRALPREADTGPGAPAKQRRPDKKAARRDPRQQEERSRRTGQKLQRGALLAGAAAAALVIGAVVYQDLSATALRVTAHLG